MDSTLVTAMSGALAQSKRIEVIANNLANADTPSFKSDDLIFEESLSAAHRQDLRADIPERPLNDSELFSRNGEEVRPVLYGAEFTDLRAGAFRQTSNSLDLAIEGNGFLEVLTPSGIRLTRAGNLALDAQGRLTTHEGFLVLGAGNQTGTPALRAITVGSDPVTFDVEGNVYRNSGAEEGPQLVGRLSILQVENPAALKKVGSNLFEAGQDSFTHPFGARAPAAAAAFAAKTNPLGPTSRAPRVHQGMVEGSNVVPVAEMTKLIQSHRLFDQNAKLMQTVGDMNAKAAEIGKF
jgi:flagellar basal-body rod protein FlgF